MPYRDINLWNEYERWLLHRIDFEDSRYTKLVHFLHNIEYHPVLYDDENRAEDGNYLRYYFFDDICASSGDFPMSCSVLEMMVSLSIRVDDEYIGDPSDPKPGDFLYEMLSNLGLDKLDNSHFDEEMLGDILSKWMNREYDYDGNGSIFPLESPMKDQRECSIWSQLQEYIMENY